MLMWASFGLPALSLTRSLNHGRIVSVLSFYFLICPLLCLCQIIKKSADFSHIEKEQGLSKTHLDCVDLSRVKMSWGKTGETKNFSSFCTTKRQLSHNHWENTQLCAAGEKHSKLGKYSRWSEPRTRVHVNFHH